MFAAIWLAGSHLVDSLVAAGSRRATVTPVRSTPVALVGVLVAGLHTPAVAVAERADCHDTSTGARRDLPDVCGE